MHSHTCLCLCERSQLEPLCTHILTSISIHISIMDSFVYEPMLCELTFVFCHFECSHFFFVSCIYSQTYSYYIIQTLVYEPMFSQMVVPLQVLTLGTSSYSHICSQVDIFHTTDTLVYDSVLCELTYVCALVSAHT